MIKCKLHASYWGWNDLNRQNSRLNAFYTAEARENQAIIDRPIKTLPIQLSDTKKLTKKIAKHSLERQPNRTARAHKTAKKSMLHDLSQNMREEHQMIQQM
jgi:hypothetical protein